MGEPGAGQGGTGQVRTGQVGTGQVFTSWFRTVQVRTGQVKTSQACQVRTGQIGQVLLGTRLWPYSTQSYLFFFFWHERVLEELLLLKRAKYSIMCLALPTPLLVKKKFNYKPYNIFCMLWFKMAALKSLHVSFKKTQEFSNPKKWPYLRQLFSNLAQILHQSRWDMYETSLFYKSPFKNTNKNRKFAMKFLYLCFRKQWIVKLVLI